MLFDYLPALEDKQGWQTPNAICHRAFRRHVHVALDNEGLVLKLRGKGLKVWRKGLTRPAPGRPEVDKHRKFAFQDYGLKIYVCYVEHCSHQAEILKTTGRQVQHDIRVAPAYLPLQYGNVIG